MGYYGFEGNDMQLLQVSLKQVYDAHMGDMRPSGLNGCLSYPFFCSCYSIRQPKDVLFSCSQSMSTGGLGLRTHRRSGGQVGGMNRRLGWRKLLGLRIEWEIYKKET